MCIGTMCELACCCGASAVCCCTKGIAKGMNAAPKTYARINYVVFQVIWVVLTVVLMYILKWTLSTTTAFGFSCPSASGG